MPPAAPPSAWSYDIIHLVHSYYPDDPRPRREARLAAGLGARVAVIALAGGSDARPVARDGAITVIRLPGRRHRGSFGKYVVEYLDFLLRARRLIGSRRQLREARIVHVHTLPDFLVAAAGPARRRGARVILDMHEIFPEFTQVKYPGLGGRLGRRVALYLERWSRRQADALLTVNDAVAGVLRRRPAAPDERIVVVHNYSDQKDFGPPRSPGGQVHDPIRLVYHGTLTSLYGLDIAVDAIHRARASAVAVTFDIYGDGPERTALDDKVIQSGLRDTVRLHGPVPAAVLRDTLPQCDAGFLSTRLNAMTRYSLSTKLLECVHLGLPTIIPAIPTYLDYLSPEGAWFYQPGSDRDAARAIEEFARASPEERRRRARIAQEKCGQRIEYERDGRALQQLYRQLWDRTAPR